MPNAKRGDWPLILEPPFLNALLSPLFATIMRTTTGHHKNRFFTVHEEDIVPLADTLGISSSAYCQLQDLVIHLIEVGGRGVDIENFTVEGTIKQITTIVKEGAKNAHKS